MASYSRLQALSLETFRSGFNLENFIDCLYREVLSESEVDENVATRVRGPSPTVRSKEALDKVRKLLDHFKRCEFQMRSMHETVTSQLETARASKESEQEEFKGVVGVVEQEMERLREQFKNLDKKMGNFGRTNARVGERLKRSSDRQERARDALELIEYMQAFSFAQGSGNFDTLPDIFLNPHRLPEAAAVSQRLLLVSSDLRTAKQRVGIDGGGALTLGSIDYAVARLEEYANDLENRVVMRFDGAASIGDTTAMGECAHIMAELNREMTLAQRYISTRPMFLDAKEIRLGETTPWQSSMVATRDLQALYREILAIVKHEAQIIEVVFPSSYRAMQIFLQRVMEQRVRSALDRILVSPKGQSADPAELRSYIRLVAEVYEKTHTLAVNLERVTKDQLDLLDLADSLFTDYLADYPEIELEWMSGMYERQESNDDEGGLNLDIVSVLTEWNKEAIGRCKTLTPHDQLAHRQRQLFHSSTFYHANLGCLLEQIARHTMRGLETARDLSELGSTFGITSASLGDLSAKSIASASDNLISHGIGHVLKSVSISSQIVHDLERYTKGVVMPLVSTSVAESAACDSGLSALVLAVETRVLENLNHALKMFFNQVAKVLVVEQKKNEFRPSGGIAFAIDQPTTACRIICAMLDSLRRAAQSNLDGTNLSSFLDEVGCQAHECLANHLTRFSFSPSGALKLKRDMAEFVDTTRRFSSVTVNQLFESLQQLVNVFIVAPESLLGLVDGTLRISHKDAMRYVQQREDFKTARVEGRTLAQLFTSDIKGFD
ncbi:hypothetical protein BSKO_05376 [Bryopsis sp. KO-2023]|nr:hypothetical protein BSKO_05376 [Bryopsis sp. KO-2023]